jgi:hypothetical protein
MCTSVHLHSALLVCASARAWLVCGGCHPPPFVTYSLFLRANVSTLSGACAGKCAASIRREVAHELVCRCVAALQVFQCGVGLDHTANAGISGRRSYSFANPRMQFAHTTKQTNMRTHPHTYAHIQTHAQTQIHTHTHTHTHRSWVREGFSSRGARTTPAQVTGTCRLCRHECCPGPRLGNCKAGECAGGDRTGFSTTLTNAAAGKRLTPRAIRSDQAPPRRPAQEPARQVRVPKGAAQRPTCRHQLPDRPGEREFGWWCCAACLVLLVVM